MPSRKVWIAGLTAAAIWTPTLRAQTPGAAPGPGAGSAVGGAGAPGAVPAAAASAAPAAAQPTTLCSLIGLGPALAKCKAHLCASQFGQMLNSMVSGPMPGVTGGFIPPQLSQGNQRAVNEMTGMVFVVDD